MPAPHPADTIAALSSAPGPGGRAVVRVSGPEAFAVVGRVFTPAVPRGRGLTAGEVRLPGVTAGLPAEVVGWPGPASYTGQDLLELHTLGSPPLVEALVAALLASGARAAGPGEFTLRAFLGGKLDLTRAEAVHGVIEAADRAELTQALGQLAGGVARPMQQLRDDLLNLLADVEAGLDFADEDIQFVDQDQGLLRLGSAIARVMVVGQQLASRATAGRPFRVALAGRPNAGKSSLFNALAGADALVSDRPGTTRDYLTRELTLGGARVELIDTPGWMDAAGPIEEQAQALGRDRSAAADLVLVCVEAGAAVTAAESQWLAGGGLLVTTKADLTPGGGGLVTSAVTGAGLEALRAALADGARGHAQPALAPSVSRCQNHVERCLAHLRRAHALVLFEDPPELLALELREALDELGEMVGAVYTDDLLDRLFSRFCIGK